MIRKFAVVRRSNAVPLLVCFLMILAGTTIVRAQQTPAQPNPAQQPSAPQPAAQQPDNPQSSTQEATVEESTSRRKTKPKDFRNWSFNVGGGASLTNGTTTTFARGGGGVAAAGVARNYSKYFSFRLDFQWDNLPFRNSALQLAQAPSATNHVYSLNLDPLVNIPVTKVWGGYILAGPGFYHRSGKLDSSTALPGAGCNAFFTWWGRCFSGSLPLNGNFLSESQNEFGFNFGAGITRKITPRIEIYGEFRDLHGSHSGITTDLRPVTIGVRW
jgi:hypothetical protein